MKKWQINWNSAGVFSGSLAKDLLYIELAA